KSRAVTTSVKGSVFFNIIPFLTLITSENHAHRSWKNFFVDDPSEHRIARKQPIERRNQPWILILNVEPKEKRSGISIHRSKGANPVLKGIQIELLQLSLIKPPRVGHLNLVFPVPNVGLHAVEAIFESFFERTILLVIIVRMARMDGGRADR